MDNHQNGHRPPRDNRPDARPFKKSTSGFARKPGATGPQKPGEGFAHKPGAGPRRDFKTKPAPSPASRPLPPREATPARPAPTGMDARKLALQALCDVTMQGAYAQLALDAKLRASSIPPEEKRLATSIFYAALENRLQIAYILAQFVNKMPEPAVENVLHIALAQLFFLDKIPDHAAVDEAVKQVKALRERYVPLVNGALRSVLRARDAGEIRYPDAQAEPMLALSIRYSVPEPLVALLAGDYGVEAAEQIMAYRPETRYQIVRPNLLKFDGPAFERYLMQAGYAFVPGLAPYAYRVTAGGDLAATPDFKAGYYSLQGEGSILAALAVKPKFGQTLLDACAAPGGKSALLCELMGGTGRVVALEKHAHRVELIRATKKRLRLDNLRVIERDATVPMETAESAYDAVLLDAPCSGLGVFMNKPDIKYRVTVQDVAALVALQRDLLDACAHCVKPGGRLVYATCTLAKDENERQVAAFLKRRPDYALDPDASFLPDALKAQDQGGMLQILPNRDHLEGFFIARMIRRRV